MLNGKKIVGLCITRVCNPTSHLMITSLNSRLRNEGYNVFVYTVSTDLYYDTPTENGEMSVFKLIDFDVVDVLVVMYEMLKNQQLKDYLISRAKEKGIPVFVVDGKHKGCININFDYHAGFEHIVRHVIETHAVKKPHFMAGMKDNAFSDARIDIFKRVIADNNISFDESMVSYGDFWDRPTVEATEKLFQRAELPEAIICANDTMALSVCTVLKKHCVLVPEDIIVTGFDGIDDVLVANPTISTYRCSNAEVADKIADILLSGDIPIEGADLNILPGEQLGQSCGCVRHRNIDTNDYLSKLNNRFNRYQAEEHHLFGLMAKILHCKSISEVAVLLRDANDLYDVCFMLYSHACDENVSPIEEFECGEDTLVLYDSDDTDSKEKPYMFKRSDIIPDIQRQLDLGDPLIFTAINFLNVPMGYTCFHFHNYDIDNYYKITQTVNILNNALGGYRNMRYQQYLNNRLEEIYKLDRMTGLYNRNALVALFEDMTEELKQGGEKVTFVLSDLDRLKYINDTYGHTEGDFAISAVGEALKSVCPKDAFVARWGGDELVALFRGECDADAIRSGVLSYLERLRNENGKPYELTSSVGTVTAVLGQNDTLDDITKLADELMYKDKVARRKSRE